MPSLNPLRLASNLLVFGFTVWWEANMAGSLGPSLPFARPMDYLRGSLRCFTSVLKPDWNWRVNLKFSFNFKNFG